MDREKLSTGMTTADWAGARAQAWASMADRLEAQIEPVSDLLFAAAQPVAGERVLDVGCGRGSTTQLAAGAVGPAGEVVGLDVAANLIEEAERLAPDDAAIRWMVADAQRAELPPEHFDLVLSRFGVMFFDDPTAAFANLAGATAPGGRLCVAVWQTRATGQRSCSDRSTSPSTSPPGTASPWSCRRLISDRAHSGIPAP